jgi:hypothetical protein
MGPFCPLHGTSPHETLIDLASTDKIVIQLTDKVGADEGVIADIKVKFTVSIPYVPLNVKKHSFPGLISTDSYGDEMELNFMVVTLCSHNL